MITTRSFFIGIDRRCRKRQEARGTIEHLTWLLWMQYMFVLSTLLFAPRTEIRNLVETKPTQFSTIFVGDSNGLKQ